MPMYYHCHYCGDETETNHDRDQPCDGCGRQICPICADDNNRCYECVEKVLDGSEDEGDDE